MKVVKRFLVPLALLVMALVVASSIGLDRSLERWFDRQLGQDQKSVSEMLVEAVESLSEERPSFLLSDLITEQWDIACIHETYTRQTDDRVGQDVFMTPGRVADGYAIALIRGDDAKSYRLSSERVFTIQLLENEEDMDCYGTSSLEFGYVGKNEDGRLVLSVRPED